MATREKGGAIRKLKKVLPLGVKGPLKRAARPLKSVVPPRLRPLLYPEWHRQAVGGLWNVLGPLQLDFLVREGLRPEHYLLDVGCGSLRGGVHFIRYLEPGHYYGVDKNPYRLESGRNVELERYGLSDSDPVLVHLERFELETLGRSFDYALGQSLFSHLPPELIELCLRGVERVLVPGGRFYATFKEAARAGSSAVDRSHLPFEKDPIYRYHFSELESLCEGTGLDPSYLGDWGHPRGQVMAVFKRGSRR